MPDMDGYPTRAELEAILTFEGTPHEFVDYINSIWWHDGFRVSNGRDNFRKSVKRLHLSTWGWSGNEEIIGVLQQTWLWFMWWRQSNRGGHYIFEVPTKSFDTKFSQPFGLPHSKVE